MLGWRVMDANWWELRSYKTHGSAGLSRLGEGLQQ